MASLSIKCDAIDDFSKKFANFSFFPSLIYQMWWKCFVLLLYLLLLLLLSLLFLLLLLFSSIVVYFHSACRISVVDRCSFRIHALFVTGVCFSCRIIDRIRLTSRLVLIDFGLKSHNLAMRSHSVPGSISAVSATNCFSAFLHYFHRCGEKYQQKPY